MPLFNPQDAKSCEVNAALALADRLSECEQFQELAEKDDPSEARLSIQLGDVKPPANGEAYTRDELDQRHLLASIFPENEESHTVREDNAALSAPRVGGLFGINLIRQVREGEEMEDAFLFFWDRVAAIQVQLDERARTVGMPRVRSDIRIAGPWRSPRSDSPDLGEYVHTMLSVAWGDETGQ